MLASTIEGYTKGLFLFSARWQLIGYLWIFLSALVLILFISSFLKFWKKIEGLVKYWLGKLPHLRSLSLIIFLIILILYPILTFGGLSKHFAGYFFRLSVLWLFALVGCFALKSFYRRESIKTLFFVALMFIGVSYQIANYFRFLSDNPFSLGWSEGSRYYYASLPFSQTLYGLELPLSFMHPSRYILQAVPFLVNGLSIAVHRAWQVLMWIVLVAIGVWGLVRRLQTEKSIYSLLFFAGGFLFLFQGPVYYHLMISAILILWAFNSKKFWKSAALVLLASLWAGISRINWFPLPGILAALIYVLEVPFNTHRDSWKILKRPAGWIAIGLLASSSAQLAYIPLSGNQSFKDFGTSFTSDLLWYRLLPNPTFPKGILTGILMLSSPLLLLAVVFFTKNYKKIHWSRMLFIISALILFFGGGLVVSVKIGGGSNLHNMDAYMLLLLTLGGYILFSKLSLDKKASNSKGLTISPFLCLLLILLPVFWALASWAPFPTLDKEKLQEELACINKTTARITQRGGNVLFFSQRQLLVFNYVKDTPLIPDYELLTLMEMSIAGYEDYLSQFHDDLRNHRFDLIVGYKQYIVFKEAQDVFPEENNAWVKNISVPLLRYYTPITWLRYTDTEIYVPREPTELN